MIKLQIPGSTLTIAMGSVESVLISCRKLPGCRYFLGECCSRRTLNAHECNLKRPRTAFLFETESIIISASVAIRRTGCKREGVLARQHRSKSNFSHMVFPFIHAAKNLNRSDYGRG